MPLFSDLSSYYYTSSLPSTSHYYHMPTTYSVPSRIATPYSFSYLSPLTAMMSAGIGGINPMPRGLMSRSAYTPILPTISETSSPILSRREISSPRSIGGKVYYRAPRPVVIDTADIDVSKRKKDEDDGETSTTGKIHRGRSVVRIHTKKLKENPGLKKKTQGELLVEKFLIKEKPEPKQEPRRRRVWETDPIPEDTTASPPQVTPTASPSATPVCRRGTVKRYISGVKKKSDPLPDVESTEKDDGSERKVSIDELLKEEAAILDSMIQEEMAKPVNEMLGKRKKSGELPDIDDTGTKHKTKTKREGKLYGGKKSSKILPLDSVDKSDESAPKHYVSKKSSKTLPLDAVNEITDSTVNKSNEGDNLIAEQIQSEEKNAKKSHKSYKKKHSGPLKFIIGSVHVEETSSPKPARKLNYEVIIEESSHNDGTKQTLRDIKKRKSKKPSIKKYSTDQKTENEDIVKIDNNLKSKGLSSTEVSDQNKNLPKCEECLDNNSSSSSSSIKNEVKSEECVPQRDVKGREDEVNKSVENSVEYDGKKLAIKNFLEKVVHKTDLPQMKEDMKYKVEKDVVINKKIAKTKSTGKDVENNTPLRADYYEKFKSVNTILKSSEEKPVTVDKKNEVSGISAKYCDQYEPKRTSGFSLSSAEHTELTGGVPPNAEWKNTNNVEKVNNEKIIPDVIRNLEEKKTANNVEVPKQMETKFLQKVKEVREASEHNKSTQISDKSFNVDRNVLPSKTTETSTVTAESDSKEKSKSDVSNKLSVEKLDAKSEEVISESVPKTMEMFEVGEKSLKLNKDIKKVLPSKSDMSAKVNDLEKKLEKTELIINVKNQSESSKSLNEGISISQTISSKNSQGTLQQPGKNQNLHLTKPELSTEVGKIKGSFINDMKICNLNSTDDLISQSITKNVKSEKDAKQSSAGDALKAHEIPVEKHSKRDYQDVNKSADFATVTSQNEEKQSVGSITDKITAVDSKQLAIAKKIKPFVKTIKLDAPTHEVVHESTKIEKCMVGESSEATLLSDKHVDSSQATKEDTVTSSVEIHSLDSKQVETESLKEDRVINLNSSISSEVNVLEKKEKEIVKEDSSATKILDSQSGSPSKEVNSSLVSWDYFKPKVQKVQELKEQSSKRENIYDLSYKGAEDFLKTITTPKISSPDFKQPLLSKKTDILFEDSKLDDSVSDASKSLKIEKPSIAGSTSESASAVTEETGNNLFTLNKMKQDKVFTPYEIHSEEQVKSELLGEKGKEVGADDTKKTVTYISEVKDTNKIVATETAEVKKSDMKRKPVLPKDLKATSVTGESQTAEKLKILDKSESSEITGKFETVGTVKENKAETAVVKKSDMKNKPLLSKDLKAPSVTGESQLSEKLKIPGKSDGSEETGKVETTGTVKENKAAKKIPLEDAVDAKPKETEPGKAKKLVKSRSKNDDKQTEGTSTVKVTKSPKHIKPEESKLSPTKRKQLVKKKSAEEPVSANDKTILPEQAEAITSTEASGNTVLASQTESFQKKAESVAKAKFDEKISAESSCVKQDSPKKLNTVVRVKDTVKTEDKSVNCVTNSVPKDTDGGKHSEDVGAVPSPVSSSDEDSSTEEEGSSDEEETSSEEETSTEEESSDDDECDVNCHRKCEKLMPNLCGINQKLIVEALTSVKKASVESKDKGSPTRRQSNAALSLENLSSDSLDGYKMSRSGRVTPPATTIPRFRKYCIDDFQFLKVLGKGSFGKVLLAELKGTQYYYAVKCLKKDVVLEDDDVECTLIERKVLVLGTKHPYLCHLFCTFQTNSHLFFVMEYLNGGDLMFHIQQEGRFDEGRARFYAAEIVSGLKFLHKKGIIYRDLKLDNILLDFDGHVRIADFGMCKLQIYLDRTADTFCGTPDYMAPEIIKGLKYNQCVDWWSFGILLYEMLVGQSPFSGCDEDDLFWCVCNRQPQYPRFITVQAKKILSQLLEKESSKRLGSSENGATDVMLHVFFDGIDWQRLERRELVPPFKPNVKHPLDVQYFDKAFTAERARLTPIEPSILQSMDQTQFTGFSYTNPNVTD